MYTIPADAIPLRDLYPDYFDYVVENLQENDYEHGQECEWAESYKRLQIKRRILAALAPDGYYFHVFKCDVCKGYHGKYHTFHVELLENYWQVIDNQYVRIPDSRA